MPQEGPHSTSPSGSLASGGSQFPSRSSSHRVTHSLFCEFELIKTCPLEGCGENFTGYEMPSSGLGGLTLAVVSIYWWSVQSTSGQSHGINAIYPARLGKGSEQPSKVFLVIQLSFSQYFISNHFFKSKHSTVFVFVVLIWKGIFPPLYFPSDFLV